MKIKERISKYLARKNYQTKSKYFIFFRFLFYLIEDKMATRYAEIKLGDWIFSDKSRWDLYNKLEDFWISGNVLYIYTASPGLWIGKFGSTIDNLEIFLNNKTEEAKANNLKEFNFKIDIIEDRESNKLKLINFQKIKNDY